MQFLESIFQSLIAYALPSACIACGHFQNDSICKKCLLHLQTNGLLAYECCLVCGIGLQATEIAKRMCTACMRQRPFFDSTVCLDRYDGILQKGLQQLKYQKRIACAHGLASAWNQLISSQAIDQLADYLLPVPLSEQKLAVRGFNQSWELTKLIRCNPRTQKSPYILRRHHHNQQQAGSSLINRHSLAHEMFYIEPMHLKLLENKTIIVFDDVMTSGATLNEIARILKHNGALHVINWVLLRTPRPNS